jgi:hypothetical protein
MMGSKISGGNLLFLNLLMEDSDSSEPRIREELIRKCTINGDKSEILFSGFNVWQIHNAKLPDIPDTRYISKFS